ncbi:MAG: hypothetical protein V4793_27290 [Paraburkholderia tropica]
MKAYTRHLTQTEEILQVVTLTARKSCVKEKDAQAMRGESVNGLGGKSTPTCPVSHHALRDAP